MTQPAVEPNWASDATFASGPKEDADTKLDVGDPWFAQGFVPGNKFVAEPLNYVLYWLCQWASYVKTLHTQTVGFLNQAFTWTGLHSWSAKATMTGGLDVNTGNVLVKDGTLTVGESGDTGDKVQVYGKVAISKEVTIGEVGDTAKRLQVYGDARVSDDVYCDRVEATGAVGTSDAVYAGNASGKGHRLTSDGTPGGATYYSRKIQCHLGPSLYAEGNWTRVETGGYSKWQHDPSYGVELLRVPIERLPLGSAITKVSAHVIESDYSNNTLGHVTIQLRSRTSTGVYTAWSVPAGTLTTPTTDNTNTELTWTLDTPLTVTDDAVFHFEVSSAIGPGGAGNETKVYAFFVYVRDYGPLAIP